MTELDLFDAVRITVLPEGADAIRPYYSQTGTTHVCVGDVGVVIGTWPGNRYRVESVDSAGRIIWQDHFERAHLEVLPATAAAFSRRRINEHWATQLALGPELLEHNTRFVALAFARKVMAFARRNVEVLAERLDHSGYQFRSHRPVEPPEPDVSLQVEELARRGIYVPVALEAWLLEVGVVDFCGTHPEWPRTGYAGMNDTDAPEREPWYTDPLVVVVSLQSILEDVENAEGPDESGSEYSIGVWIDIAPDVVHKANVSGGEPVMMSAVAPRFDDVLVGQAGSLTLLSYLRLAFDWGGFPGFEYIADAPTTMLADLRRNLTRL